MIVEKLVVGFLKTNCYIVYSPDNRGCAVIDPGGESRRICADLEKRGLTPDVILLTHAHADHVRGLWHLYEKTGACVYVHAGIGRKDQHRSFPLRSTAENTVCL